MRLVTWNCKGAFAQKHRAIVSLSPDVIVLPESEEIQGVNAVLAAKPVNSFKWVGQNPRKGLGVVSYGSYALSVHPDFDPNIRWIVPLLVDGPDRFLLLAVWTVPNPVDGVYVHALFRALERYGPVIREHPTVMAGDFNQSVRFDKPNSPLSFSRWMTLAEELGLQSAYHHHSACEHGQEPAPTFFLHHAAGKGHHIDFVFASRTLLSRLSDVSVGVHSEWARLSDHMPLLCSFAPSSI